MKYKNKNGISLNYSSDDIHTRLVKEVISEAVSRLEDFIDPSIDKPSFNVDDTIEFLKENFNLENMGELKNDK